MPQDPARTPAIAFEDVTYRAPGGKALLSQLNLAVPAGETFVLVGASGCGKTTTMRLINRLLDPTSGVVTVEGKATTAWDPIQLRRRIGYVIQDAGLFPHRTVAENVALVPGLLGWAPARIAERVEALLALMGLPASHFAGRFPHELSGGQRQRVGIARALAADPPIMLLDEPFSALDPVTRRGIQLEFRALQARLGKTLVFVTHDIREALLMGTRLAFLQDGALRLVATPEIFKASTDPAVREFLACLDDAPPLEAAP